MASAAVFGAITAVSAVASTAIGITSAIMQASQQQAYARRQAEQAEYMARYMQQQGEYQAQIERNQAEYMAQTSRNRAQYEEQRAEQMRAAGEVARIQKLQEGERLLGRQLSMYGAAGVEPTMGSPLLVMEETAAQVERDALMERYKYQLGASGAEMDASSLFASANLQKWQGETQANLYDFQAKTQSGLYGMQAEGYRTYGRGVASTLPLTIGKTLVSGGTLFMEGMEKWKPFSKIGSRTFG